MSTICPECSGPKTKKAKLCRKCTKPYVRSKALRESQSKLRSGICNRGTGWHHSNETKQLIAYHWTKPKRSLQSFRSRVIARSRRWQRLIAYKVSGPRNANYKGRKRDYRPGWGKAYKDRLRKRARGICQLCHKFQQTPLDLHHKDFTKSNHSATNIIAICRSCHLRLHAEQRLKQHPPSTPCPQHESQVTEDYSSQPLP